MPSLTLDTHLGALGLTPESTIADLATSYRDLTREGRLSPELKRRVDEAYEALRGACRQPDTTTGDRTNPT